MNLGYIAWPPDRRFDGHTMNLRKALARMRYTLSSIVIDVAMLVVVCGLVATLAPALFILSAQLFRLVTAGEWRGVSLAELLEMFRLELPPDVASGSIAAFFLASPATLLLLLAALLLFPIGRLLYKAGLKERKRFLGARQKALIEDLDREMKQLQQ